MMAQGREYWRELVRELIAEQGVSYRQICRDTGMNRATLRRWLALGSSHMPITMLETLLAYLGYELDAIRRADGQSVRGEDR